MRYFKEYRHKFSNASGEAINAAKKLLGYMENQKRLSGVESLIERIKLTDGTIVECRIDKNISSARILNADGGDAACTMYVESGLLDLGPNIASDAGERFSRGLPAFGDDPATLYFGDGVECVDGQPGLNGPIRVQNNQLTSGCLPSGGASVTSSLSDPVKKQAQALQPASNWSGLMRRYVQAVYGGNTLPYSATATTLTIGNATIPTADSVGLLDFAGTLRLVTIEEGVVSLREVLPSSACVSAVLQAWQSRADDDPSKDKLLTIALSGCLIGNVIATGTIAATGNRHFAHRSAWVFDHDTPKAVAVLETGGTATAYEATFSLAGSTVSASLSSLASGEVLNCNDWPLYAASGSPFDSPAAEQSGLTNEAVTALEAGDSYDFPVYAHYVDGVASVVSMSIVVSDAAITDQTECYDADDLYGPAVISDDDSRRCRSNLEFAYSVAYGYYGTGWSAVTLKTAFPGGGSTVLMSASLGVQAFLPEAMTTLAYDKSPSGSTYNAGDLYGSVYGAGFDGTASTGCELYNTLFGATSAEEDNLPVNPSADCSVWYNYPYGTFMDIGGVLIHAERPYFPSYAALFEGTAYGLSPQVLSLAWGAVECMVVDAYALAGGQGAYLSCEGAARVNDGGIVPEESYATASGTMYYDVYTYDTPGDCGGTSTLTGPHEPFSAVFTKTQPSPGIVVASMADMLTLHRDVTAIRGVYRVPAMTTPGFLDDATVYPDPRIRGAESFRSQLAFAGTTDLFTTSRDADIAIPDLDSPFYHPDGVDEYVANDDAGADSPSFPFAGMQELSDAHLESDLAGEAAATWVAQDLAAPTWLVEGFAYQAAHSLLGAKVIPTPQLARGTSLNMDRQTITGGYSTVSTPSFVGWA